MKRSIKKISSILLALTMMLPLSLFGALPTEAASPKYTATEGWGPNAEGVYEIGTPGDLLAFYANASANSWYKNKTIVLTADIDLNPGWDASTGTAPTNVWGRKFDYMRGTIDGQGHTIKGFYVKGTNAAIFSSAEAAMTIKNLKIENSYFHATAAEGVGIFRYARGTATFENVYMDAICIADEGPAAGFISYFRGDSDSNKPTLIFKNCAFAGTVTGKTSAGAFVGTNDKPKVTGGSAYSVTMTDCVNYGTITCKDSSGYAAGLIGNCANKATLTRCYNAGETKTALINITKSTFENLDKAPVTVTMDDCYYLAGNGVLGTTATADAVTTLTLNYDGATATAVKTATAEELVAKDAFKKSGDFQGWTVNANKAAPAALGCFIGSHDYVAGTTVAPDRCVSDGFTPYTCSRCGSITKGDIVAKAEHNSVWVIDNAATETSTGLRHRECSVCKEVFEIEVIPAKGAVGSTTEKDYNTVKTYNITENLDYIKTHGRTSVTTQGLACDHAATGIEFTAGVKGKVTLTVQLKNNDSKVTDCYFTLWVDGVRQPTRFKAVAGEKNTFELGDFATEGIHTFRLLRQTEAHWANADLQTISFAGGFEVKPANSNLYIEFIGASMFGGYGNLGTTSTKNPSHPVNSDATQAYPYLTAAALGADHSVVSRAGIGVLPGETLPAYKLMYSANSYFRSTTDAYEPTRVPDLIVSGLGHNDISKMKGDGTTLPESERENYKVLLKDLVLTIRELYKTNVPIIWTHNMMGTGSENFDIYANTVKEAFEELGGEEAGLFVLKLTANRAGGGSHPTLAGHSVQSQELVNFILQEGVLNKDYGTFVDPDAPGTPGEPGTPSQPADTTDPADTETAAVSDTVIDEDKKRGCGGSIAFGGAIGMIASLGMGATVLKKKRK